MSTNENYKGYIIRESEIFSNGFGKSKSTGSIQVRKPLNKDTHQLIKSFNFSTSTPEKKKEAIDKAKSLINSLPPLKVLEKQ